MRPYNFSPGPAVLPLEVLQQAREELLDWNGSGMSVMEISHRGAAFMRVAAEAEEDLRELMAVPSDYEVLFMQGGASAQFAFVPLNLTTAASTADYVNTGHWSKKALAEAWRYCKVRVAGDAGGDYLRVPPQSELKLNPHAAYVHYTPNETIGGVEFGYVPQTGGVPLVADMSSNILSRPIDVSRYGLIYAGAQKNIGPSGLTVGIVHRDLIGPAAAVERKRAKARLLYAAIDGSSLYRNTVQVDSRSRMNATFTLKKPELDALFIEQAAAAGRADPQR